LPRPRISVDGHAVHSRTVDKITLRFSARALTNGAHRNSPKESYAQKNCGSGFHDLFIERAFIRPLWWVIFAKTTARRAT
jgi:hypothetical protein